MASKILGRLPSFMGAGQVKDLRLCKEVCHSWWSWDNSFKKKSPDFPPFRHKASKEGQRIVDAFNSSSAKAELSKLPNMKQGRVHNLGGCKSHSFIILRMSCGIPVEDYNGNVSALCKQGQLKHALDLLDIMDQRHIKTDSSTYACLLQGCTKMKALAEGKRVHAHISKSMFEHDILLLNTLVRMYAKCGSMINAQELFTKMSKRNLFSWNAMIVGYVELGHDEEAVQLFREMLQGGIKPDKFTVTSVLKACASLTALDEGKWIHTYILKSGIVSDIFVEVALIDMYSKCGSIEHARTVFDNMCEQNVVSWTAMITGYVKHGHIEEALKLFGQMQQEGVKPNVVSWTAVIAGSAQHGHGEKAYDLFREMQRKGIKPDVVLWNAMIAGHIQHGYCEKAFEFFGQMQQGDIKPDRATFVSILNACASLAVLEQGKEVHANLVKYGFQTDTSVGTALADMYAKCGSIKDAHAVFESISKRDVVLFNVMIAGYAMNGHGKDAIQSFQQMLEEGFKPDRVTFINVLSACSHTGLVDEGCQYFNSIYQGHGITPSTEHYACMVNLLSHVGNLNEAVELVSKMPSQPDATIWRTLLAACKLCGYVVLVEQVAECIFLLEPENAAPYVVLSNLYAASGRPDDRTNLRKMMNKECLVKQPGHSWIVVDSRVHEFVVGDSTHPQTEVINEELQRLVGQMEEAGYVRDTRFILQNADFEEHSPCGHSEKLAITFGLISSSLGTPIRVIKNLRTCSDCHDGTKFISKIARREIVVRDSNRFHHFKDGSCSCGDFW